MSEHVCACIGCKPDWFPAGDRLNEAHAAVRFGDRGPEWVVKLDGELVSRAFECVAGDPGWVLAYSADPETGRLHFCHSCGRREPCVTRLVGDVQVARQPSSSSRFGVSA